MRHTSSSHSTLACPSAAAPPSFTSQASDKEHDNPSGGVSQSGSSTSAAQPKNDHAQAGPSQGPQPSMPFMLKRGLLRYEASYGGTLARSSPQGPLECRICLQADKAEALLAPCACRGSMQFVHPACLLTWATSKVRGHVARDTSRRSRCLVVLSDLRRTCTGCAHATGQAVELVQGNLLWPFFPALAPGSFALKRPCCPTPYASRTQASPACELCSADFTLPEEVKQQLDDAIEAAVRQK